MPRSAETVAAGRTASHPRGFGWRDWTEVLRRVVVDIGGDHLSVIAAGVAFFAMLALFPAMAALISLYGYFANVSDLSQHLAYLRPFLPREGYEIISTQLEALVTTSSSSLGIASLVALAFALWGTRAAVAALIDGLNFVYGEREQRSYVKLQLVSLVITGLMLALAILAIVAIVAVPTALRLADFGPVGAWLTALLPWPILGACVVLALGIVYRYGPDRALARKRWVTIGAVAATVIWVLASLGFSVYVGNFADYSKTYGSLGAIVILLLWFYLGAFATLLGAEINAEMELHTRRDSTTGPELPMGVRGAHVADHVAWETQKH